MKRKRIKLRYKKERVVFSDVLPYELPITFTNRFFYRFLVKNEVEYIIDSLEHKKCKLRWKQNMSIGARQVLAILFGIDSKKVMNEKKNVANVGNESSIPFNYRIMHKRGKYRELAVIHPADQIKMVSFYEKYKSLILYYCQQSRFSLRHPHAVACYFYYRDRLHHTLLGKRSDDLELYFNEYENLKTYFSYKRYTQIYRFYEDYRYQRAEKKFAHLQKFDIQACFNSIYSHSIAWATNGGKATYKRFFKGGEDGTFGAVWDSLMQKMNYNETNGIVIGPEFSRLFAEVILQYIDKCVENDLYEKGYKWNVDYECYRYVDDHFFFYNNKDVLEAARQSYAYHLNEYKMTISNEKTEDIDRPFITPISRAKLAIDKLINDTITINVDDDQFKKDESDNDAKDIAMDSEEDEIENEPMDKKRLENALGKRHTLYFRSSFFSSVFQDILKTNNVEAKDVLNYTIARMGNRCERMLKKFDRLYKPLCMADKVIDITPKMKEQAEHRKSSMEHELSLFLFNLLDSAFFIYSFNKQLNSTLKLVNLLNTIIVYLDTDYFTNDIRANVFKKIQDEINVAFQCCRYSENTQLETLYFLITLRSMRSKYHLSVASIENYIGVKTNEDGSKELPDMNAISITLFLYYFADKKEFDELRMLIVNKACERIKNVPMELHRKTSELVILLLDLMACPYLNAESKTQIGEAFGLTKKEINNLLRYFKNGRYMFTNWKKLNVTKELNAKISQEVYA
ncbi:antiviral reverse transcriptase Drt3b [Leyella stercorea]